jgi:hypothetical protein
MNMAILAIAGVLAGHQPEPRSPQYFQGHPTEAARIMADCTVGRHRGHKCETAQARLAGADADRRQELVRRSFR